MTDSFGRAVRDPDARGSSAGPSALQMADMPLEDLLDLVQRAHASYFWEGAHPRTGLPLDRRFADRPDHYDLVSIGGVGFGVMAILVLVHRGWIERDAACERLALILESLENIPRFKGALPHFVTAERLDVVPLLEGDDGGDLVETALLLQGLICARQYFSGPHGTETFLRDRINRIFAGVEWTGFVRKNARPSLYWHWSPARGWHLNTPITGWNEALVAYVLAAGSDNYPIDPDVFHLGWTNEGKFLNGASYHGHRLPAGVPHGGPLFVSQYSFCALDPRSLRDRHINYWEQVVAHSKINFEHCRRNPRGHIGYGVYGWGLTASDGPHGYLVSCPTNDQGVLAPTAALSSFPFVPREAEAAMRAFLRFGNGRLWKRSGFVDAFAPGQSWVSSCHLAINQGPIVATIENFRSGLLWDLFMSAPEIRRGLDRLEIIRVPTIGGTESVEFSASLKPAKKEQ